jgi:hypothetical protein
LNTARLQALKDLALATKYVLCEIDDISYWFVSYKLQAISYKLLINLIWLCNYLCMKLRGFFSKRILIRSAFLYEASYLRSYMRLKPLSFRTKNVTVKTRRLYVQAD